MCHRRIVPQALIALGAGVLALHPLGIDLRDDIGAADVPEALALLADALTLVPRPHGAPY